MENINKLYNKINNNTHYVIFGKSDCSYCKNTIKLLNINKMKYKYYPIDNFYNLFFSVLIKLGNMCPILNIDSSHKTVPVIFYKKQFIGGYTDLKKLLN
jgi:glutaredoxin